MEACPWLHRAGAQASMPPLEGKFAPTSPPPLHVRACMYHQLPLCFSQMKRKNYQPTSCLDAPTRLPYPLPPSILDAKLEKPAKYFSAAGLARAAAVLLLNLAGGGGGQRTRRLIAKTQSPVEIVDHAVAAGGARVGGERRHQQRVRQQRQKRGSRD